MRTAAAGAAALLCTLVLANGCTSGSDDPAPSTPPTSSSAVSTSPNSSDEVTVQKAAVKAWTDYLAEVAELGSTVTAPLTELSQYAMGTQLDEAQQALQENRDKGYVVKGAINVVSATAGGYDSLSRGLYVMGCYDTSAYSTVDAKGNLVQVPDRPTKFTYTATMRVTGDKSVSTGWRVSTYKSTVVTACPAA